MIYYCCVSNDVILILHISTSCGYVVHVQREDKDESEAHAAMWDVLNEPEKMRISQDLDTGPCCVALLSFAQLAANYSQCTSRVG